MTGPHYSLWHVCSLEETASTDLPQPFSLAQGAVSLYWTSIGLGRHASQVSDRDLTKGRMLLYANYPLYDLAISLPKLSALFFYARVFTTHGNRWVHAISMGYWSVGDSLVALHHNFFNIPVYSCLQSLVCECSRPLYQYFGWVARKRHLKRHHRLRYLDTAATSTVEIAAQTIAKVSRHSCTYLRLLVRNVEIYFYFESDNCSVILASIGRLVSVARAGRSLDEDMACQSIPENGTENMGDKRS